jgi:hypothetical protein
MARCLVWSPETKAPPLILVRMRRKSRNIRAGKDLQGDIEMFHSVKRKRVVAYDAM